MNLSDFKLWKRFDSAHKNAYLDHELQLHTDLSKMIEVLAAEKGFEFRLNRYREEALVEFLPTQDTISFKINGNGTLQTEYAGPHWRENEKKAHNETVAIQNLNRWLAHIHNTGHDVISTMQKCYNAVDPRDKTSFHRHTETEASWLAPAERHAA